ncbi:MAG: hypothetical protein Q7T58_00745 [Methylotenera sp.]|jgi:hypothetical protein|nr:hypothetical protein [Methylotenera sp.]
MNNSVDNSPLPHKHIQGTNGVETGFDLAKSFFCLIDCSNDWKEHDKLCVSLLQAICQLSIKQIDRCGLGFDSWEIRDEISSLRARAWAGADSRDEVSDKVRKQWKALEDLWPKKVEIISSYTANSHISRFPVLEKIEGGGTGRPSRYLVNWTEQSDLVADASEINSRKSSITNGQIKYVCEDIVDAGFIARVFAKGYELSSWRRWIFILIFFIPMFLGYCYAILLIFHLKNLGSSNFAPYIGSISIFGIAITILWLSLRKLWFVPTRKITLAPWWMQSTDDDRLLELRKPPQYPERILVAVRYSGHCPICGGKVYAKSGEWEFYGRIVGRCDEAPVEHVFSFDHVTKIGRFLRPH